MPTGGGKSLCFQLPALMRPGLCVVVSPLIALMQDQVEGLKQNGIRAAALMSGQSSVEQQAILDAAHAGQLKLLYVAPERLASDWFFHQVVATLPVNLFAIDEAHCISFWGHDFRPEYTRLSRLKEFFPGVPIIALTATADRLTREDIAQQLQLDNPEWIIASFDRPNLSLAVEPAHKRLERITQFLKSRPGQSGIIYCLSRRTTEQVAQRLCTLGFRAEAYHAGMDTHDRAAIQRRFLQDQVPVLCATIAFGMGINKSNIRWVIHYNVPKNLESYMQEIGRAGRDGLPADTLLFFSEADVINQRKFLEELLPEQRQIQENKLERLVEYAHADHCRRRIVLNYFDEPRTEDCRNCDVCHHPRPLVDQTILAQKALSTVARTHQQTTRQMVAGILKGAQRPDLLVHGYQHLSTWGIGQELTYEQWDELLRQLVSLGYVDTALNDRFHLKLNALSWQVLRGEVRVALPQLSTQAERKARLQAASSATSPDNRKHNELLESLKTLRARLAFEQRIAPDQVFTDPTLLELTEKMPLSRAELQHITGLSQAKYERYADVVLNVIHEYVARKTQQGERLRKGPHILSYIQFTRQNKLPEVIAAERQLKVSTVIGHLTEMQALGFDAELHRLVSPRDLELVRKALQHHGRPPERLREFQELHTPTLDYNTLRCALAILGQQPLEY
jgi:ATP-dependent DNA helicase RecQ